MYSCSHLLHDETLANNIDISSIINISNESLGEIWLDEDFTSLFDAKYWEYEFYIILILIFCIGIIMATYLICYNYPQFDKQQKLLKLKSLEIEPIILKKQVIPILNHFIDNQNVIEIILEFADITIKHENITQYINSIMISPRDIYKQSFCFQLFLFMLCWTLLIFAYIPIYFMSVHGEETYRSYVEIKCIPIHEYTDYNPTPIIQLDLTSVCGDIFKNYGVYSKLDHSFYNNVDDKCWINTNNMNKFRPNFEFHGCCPKCVEEGRCGYGCKLKCPLKCCARNLWGYLFCSCFACTMLMTWIFTMCKFLMIMTLKCKLKDCNGHING
eukprot:537024_1